MSKINYLYFFSFTGLIFLTLFVLWAVSTNETPINPKILSASVVDFSSHIQGETGRTLIDIRTPEEYESGHLDGATNLDFYHPLFTEWLGDLDRHKPLAIYCRSGNRTGKTLAVMEKMGFTDVIELSGGVVAWQEYYEQSDCSNGAC